MAESSRSAPRYVWNIMLKLRGGVRLPGSPVAGEGMSGISSGLAWVMSLAITGSSLPRTAFFRFRFSAFSCSSSVVRSPSSAET